MVQLNRCLNDGYVPIWMTKGRTTLIMKDKSKGNVASNYRPITCLPLIWKLLTGIIADGMYSFLESRDLCQRNRRDVARSQEERTTSFLLIKC